MLPNKGASALPIVALSFCECTKKYLVKTRAIIHGNGHWSQKQRVLRAYIGRVAGDGLGANRRSKGRRKRSVVVRRRRQA